MSENGEREPIWKRKNIPAYEPIYKKFEHQEDLGRFPAYLKPENQELDTRPEKIARTKEAYLDRSDALAKRFERKTNLDPLENLDRFLDFVVLLKPEIAKSTWRQYKASIVCFLEEIKQYDRSKIFSKVNSRNCKDYLNKVGRSLKTSSLKAKKLTTEELDKIQDYLLKRDGQYNIDLVMMLRATVITGLRPCEWRHATLHDLDGIEGRPAMIIKNAKSTNGRAHGPIRTLYLDRLDKDEIEVINYVIKKISRKKEIKKWENYYSGLRQVMYLATRKIWKNRKKYPTIYSARHQFSANAKSNGASPEMIAAVMGHSVTVTSMRHYGKRYDGEENQFKVEANQAEIQRVKTIEFVLYSQRKERKAEHESRNKQ